MKTGQRVSHSSQKYVVRHKEFVGCHISGLSVPDIFCLIPFLYVCGRKHNECKDMKRETVFGILGVLLYTQPSVAQKSVTDTVRLNFNIDSVALEEVVVKGARTPAANSRWSDMHPVELVTVGR